MSSLSFDALAEVVVTSFVILAVSLRDISVQIPSTAGAFQNAGKNMCVVWVADLFTPPCGTLTLCLCKIPVVLGNDGFMLTDIDGKLGLLHNVHSFSCVFYRWQIVNLTVCHLCVLIAMISPTSGFFRISEKLNGQIYTWDVLLCSEIFNFLQTAWQNSCIKKGLPKASVAS